ncbi:esterase/lipase family protein [Pseudoxanthomonas suwonensis]|uniref:esterase/lipase family protein n=1 Tax=Pseudoxanthomonas suwonensis TaxID=314722 RepID=UPI00048B896D|nr:alpha/beta hydrolase [Pseudoxanthomonas suwonensis]
MRIETVSPMSRGAYTITPAQDIPLPPGREFRQPGFGLPVVLRSNRCNDAPACELYPPEGIYQWATAWIEAQGGTPLVRVVDPVAMPVVTLGGRELRLAFDAFAAYRQGSMTSHLPSLGVYGLLRGDDVGRRAGAYLIRGYDPRKTPVVMVHGLGSHPIIWAELSGAIWADPVLREHYQVVHVVFQTNAPLLVNRLRLRTFLDRMWQLLDPEGDDPARRKMVLVGHSLGGVVSRTLAVDSGQVLWDAAFTVAPGELRGEPADVKTVHDLFLFDPYPGACALVMLAAPPRGSPTASRFAGRVVRALVGRRIPEIEALRRVTLADPDAVRDEVRDSYRAARLDSIWTLRAPQPVRRAGESLLPVAGVRYHTIAGDLHGKGGDGVVPLESALLPGARSTLVVDRGHALYGAPEVVARILDILREERELPCAGAAVPGSPEVETAPPRLSRAGPPAPALPAAAGRGSRRRAA